MITVLWTDQLQIYFPIKVGQICQPLRLPYQSPIIITECFWSNDNYNNGNDKDNKNDNNNINDNNNNNNNSENQKYKIQECDQLPQAPI